MQSIELESEWNKVKRSKDKLADNMNLEFHDYGALILCEMIFLLYHATTKAKNLGVDTIFFIEHHSNRLVKFM